MLSRITVVCAVCGYLQLVYGSSRHHPRPLHPPSLSSVFPRSVRKLHPLSLPLRLQSSCPVSLLSRSPSYTPYFCQPSANPSPTPLLSPTPASVLALLEAESSTGADVRLALVLGHALRWAVSHANVELIGWLAGLDGRWVSQGWEEWRLRERGRSDVVAQKPELAVSSNIPDAGDVCLCGGMLRLA